MLLWSLWMFIVGTSSTGPSEEYVARLDVEIDSAQQGWSIRYSSMLIIVS